MTLRTAHLTSALLGLVALGGNALAQEHSLSAQHGWRGGSIGISIGGGSFGGTCAPAPPVCPPPAGSWEVIEDRIWIPAHEARVWTEPLYQTWYDSCGHPHSRLVRPGYWRTTCEPGHWAVRTRKVWIPNYRPLSGRVHRIR